jgi:glucosyl-3-phosphoglycerate synthase
VPTGYAVELAALIDTAATRGAEAIAQVDLGRRAHRHQSLRDLGGMARQIMAMALGRAGVAAATSTAEGAEWPERPPAREVG